MTTGFRDRTEAGRQLAETLGAYKGDASAVVLGLPRGGVAPAREVADRIGAPLDVFVVRKLGVPGHAELAMGALASGGVRILNEAVIRHLGISASDIDSAAEREERELKRREEAYRGDKPPLELFGRTAILVDDGLATGATMRAAVQGARARKATRVVVAVPVAPPDTARTLRKEADEVVCLMTPPSFVAVGQWYAHFEQLTDEEVCGILHRHVR